MEIMVSLDDEGSSERILPKRLSQTEYFFLVETVGASGMMMSAEEWYDIGNYAINGNALASPRRAHTHPRSCMVTNFISPTYR